MIRFQEIGTSDATHYQFMEELLTTAFPPEEYRTLEQLRAYTDQMDNFHNLLIFDDEIPIGFITYWEFDGFYYVEHFAINPTLRNGGYGRQVLDHLRIVLSLPLVLEVELPTEEMAQRRIQFYQRQGFVLWEKPYEQPPYKAGDPYLPMYLMVYGELDSERDFEEVCGKIHRAVYGVGR